MQSGPVALVLVQSVLTLHEHWPLLQTAPFGLVEQFVFVVHYYCVVATQTDPTQLGPFALVLVQSVATLQEHKLFLQTAPFALAKQSVFVLH
jgi:hypothetical protein